MQGPGDIETARQMLEDAAMSNLVRGRYRSAQRHFVALLLIASIAVLAACAGGAEARRPNFVVIFIDDLGYEGYATGCFGKWELGASPNSSTQHGFDTYFGIPYSNDIWPSTHAPSREGSTISRRCR